MKSRLLFAFFRAFVAPNAAGMLAVSDSLRCHAQQNLAGRTPVWFAPNPVRSLPRHGPSAAPSTFVCVARLSKQKGHDILLDAFAKVRAQRGDATLTLVGAGEEDDALRARARALGIAGAVRFEGRQADPSPYLRAAQCFVLASRWEGFGQVLVEALSFGLPLAVTDCDFGPSDLVDDPRIGMVARNGDADDLARAMHAALESGSPPEAIALRQERAARFALDRVAPIHFELLQRALQARKSSAPARATLAAAG